MLTVKFSRVVNLNAYENVRMKSGRCFYSWWLMKISKGTRWTEQHNEKVSLVLYPVAAAQLHSFRRNLKNAERLPSDYQTIKDNNRQRETKRKKKWWFIPHHGWHELSAKMGHWRETVTTRLVDDERIVGHGNIWKLVISVSLLWPLATLVLMLYAKYNHSIMLNHVSHHC